jgi:hypothetical protein
VKPFKPRYIFEDELSYFGLPDSTQQPNILSLLDSASTLVDEHCGRTDGNGNGSLAYTTYQERLLLQSPNRNIVRVSFKPLATVTQATVNLLSLSGNQTSKTPYQYFYTGVLANTVVRPDVSVSPLLGASGRYGYPRRGAAAIYPDLNYGMNLLQVASYFGGPPGWTPIDCSSIDFDPATGELWVPAGLYLSQYTEIVVIYNSGFDPTNMPPAIKDATAAVVRNALAKGGMTTGLKSISGQGMVNVTFQDELIDVSIEKWLAPFKSVIAY